MRKKAEVSDSFLANAHKRGGEQREGRWEAVVASGRYTRFFCELPIVWWWCSWSSSSSFRLLLFARSRTHLFRIQFNTLHSLFFLVCFFFLLSMVVKLEERYGSRTKKMTHFPFVRLSRRHTGFLVWFFFLYIPHCTPRGTLTPNKTVIC